jgi:O-antigen/teichoic acid export membrane protein
VAAFLHVGVAGPLWVAAGLLPLALLSAAMGVLQGAERFAALALVICAQGVGKAVGLVPLALDGGPPEVLAALAGGTLLAALVALVAVGRTAPDALPEGLPTVREALAAAGGLFALLALANLDLLLARHVLPGDASGEYSAGAVCAKAAFWLPQAVVVVVFPRLSDPEAGRRLLRQAVLAVGALGLLELAGSLLLARPALELTFGEQYGSVAHLAPLFVVQGAVLSVVQLLVYRAIATRDPVAARLVLAAAAVEAVAVLALRPDSPGPVIAVAAAVAVVLASGLLLRTRRAGP